MSLSSSTPIAQLLLLRLQFEQPAELRFFHSPTVYAFLHARLGNARDAPFPRNLRLLAVETARTRYAAGDAYHIALALLPSPQLCAQDLIARLRQRRREPHLVRAALSGSAPLTRVVDLVGGQDVLSRDAPEPEWLTLEVLRRQAQPLTGARALTVIFDSPLLILRNPVQRRDTFLDETAFDPSVLLARIARAVSEHFPMLGELRLPAARLVANRLVRAETYYRGTESAAHGDSGKILPGATGSVELAFDAPLGSDFAVALLLGGLIGVGKSTAMGQGRYHVADAPLASALAARPCGHLVRANGTGQRARACAHAPDDRRHGSWRGRCAAR